MVLHQRLAGAELHQQQRGEAHRGQEAVEPLAVGGEAELDGQAEGRPGLPQRHRRQRDGVGLGGGLPLARPGAAPLLGPDAGLQLQDALLELLVGGGGGGDRGRRLRSGGGVIARACAEGRERRRVEAAVPERGAEGGDGEGAGERPRHCSLGRMCAPALHGGAAAWLVPLLVCRWFWITFGGRCVAPVPARGLESCRTLQNRNCRDRKSVV